MKKLNFFMIAICLATITGCNEISNVTIDNSTTPAKKTYSKLLFTGETKYSMFIEDAGNKIGYFSTKQDALSKEEMSVLGMTESENADNFALFKINGVAAKEIKTIAAAENFDLRNQALFGKNVKFSIPCKNAGNNGVSKAPDKGVDMYVPEIVKITSPKIVKSSELLPYCYYKNFKLCWNADPQNENGLVVIVQWTGTDMFGKKYNTSVYSLDIITEDNGEYILKNAMFDNIPQGAIVKLVLLRGNIETFQQNIAEEDAEETYQIVAASAEILPFIMVRDI